jgi:hypothetical protein
VHQAHEQAARTNNLLLQLLKLLTDQGCVDQATDAVHKAQWGLLLKTRAHDPVIEQPSMLQTAARDVPP